METVVTHWLDGPIFGFDVETTGVDVEQDRIVTYCVGMLDGQGWRQIGGVVNPGVPIPKAASDVHGVTDEQAANGMSPRDALGTITNALESAWNRGGPVVAYNAVFDLTILDRELRRHCGRGVSDGPVIDPLVLDRAVDRFRKGSRRLSDTCRHYGVTLTEEAAHTAAGDAYAAVQLARKLGETLADAFDGLPALHQFQVEQYREQRESFHAYLAKKGEVPDDDNTVWPLKPWNGDAS